MKKTAAIVSVMFAIAATAHAQTGSVKTAAQLNAEVNQLWPDQTQGTITPFGARQTLLDVIASAPTLGLFSATPKGDVNYQILMSDRYLYPSATLTAPRVWTLPAASSYPPGLPLVVQDALGNVSGTNTLTLALSGSDHYIGAASPPVLNAQFQWFTLYSDGVSNWGSALTGANNILANAVSNAKLAQAGAATLKLNATAGTANSTDTKISALTDITTPSTTLDWIPIEDHVAGTIKKTNAAELVAAIGGGVTSVTAGTGLAGGTITTTGTITAPSVMPQGRVTLQTATPVMTTSQTAKGTLFYDCYAGNAVPYFDGTKDTFDTISGCEVSDAMVSAASAGQVVSGQVYDVFWVHGGANRICVAMSASTGGGGGWASDTAGSNTARGTGYSQLDRTRGYPTNTNAITNCFNGATNYGSVAAHQGTYLATFFATANGQTSWTYGSNATGGGQAASLYVWNAHNRVNVKTSVSDSATSWTITDGLVHSFHDDAGTRLNFVMGLAEDGIGVNVFQEICANATVYQIMAIGFALDRSGNTTFDKVTINYVNSTAVAAVGLWCGSESVNSTYAPQLGAHFVQALENQDGQATAWVGTYFGGIRTSFDGYFRM